MKTLDQLKATGTAEELTTYINERETRHRRLMKELKCLLRIREAQDDVEDDSDKEVAAS